MKEPRVQRRSGAALAAGLVIALLQSGFAVSPSHALPGVRIRVLLSKTFPYDSLQASASFVGSDRTLHAYVVVDAPQRAVGLLSAAEFSIQVAHTPEMGITLGAFEPDPGWRATHGAADPGQGPSATRPLPTVLGHVSIHLGSQSSCQARITVRSAKQDTATPGPALVDEHGEQVSIYRCDGASINCPPPPSMLYPIWTLAPNEDRFPQDDVLRWWMDQCGVSGLGIGVLACAPNRKCYQVSQSGRVVLAREIPAGLRPIDFGLATDDGQHVLLGKPVRGGSREKIYRLNLATGSCDSLLDFRPIAMSASGECSVAGSLRFVLDSVLKTPHGDTPLGLAYGDGIFLGEELVMLGSPATSGSGDCSSVGGGDIAFVRATSDGHIALRIPTGLSGCLRSSEFAEDGLWSALVATDQHTVRLLVGDENGPSDSRDMSGYLPHAARILGQNHAGVTVCGPSALRIFDRSSMTPINAFEIPWSAFGARSGILRDVSFLGAGRLLASASANDRPARQPALLDALFMLFSCDGRPLAQLADLPGSRHSTPWSSPCNSWPTVRPLVGNLLRVDLACGASAVYYFGE